MPFIKPFEKIPAIKIQKRLGRPNKCGWAMCGWSQCGDTNEYSGVYQQRRPRKGNGIGSPIIFGSQKNFFQKPAWPSHPPSEARTAQNNKFKTALSMWQNLTTEEKEVYNKIAIKRSKRGYDLFMSKTLKSL